MVRWVRCGLFLVVIVECETDPRMHPVVSDFARVYGNVRVLGKRPPETMCLVIQPREVDEYTHELHVYPTVCGQQKYWYATIGQHAYLWGDF